MIDTLRYILGKFNLHSHPHPETIYAMPIQLHNFGRIALAGLFRELGFAVGAEIGIERAMYSEVLCKANPFLHLHCIDPWKAYRGYRDHVDQLKLDAFYVEAQSRMSAYHCTFIRKFSLDAVKDIPNASLDFVYIDGNHDFQNVTNDIVEWGKKVRPGGIVSGHDYNRHLFLPGRAIIQVYEVVNAYTAAYHISPWFVLKGLKRTPEMTTDDGKSWMWVKT